MVFASDFWEIHENIDVWMQATVHRKRHERRTVPFAVWRAVRGNLGGLVAKLVVAVLLDHVVLGVIRPRLLLRLGVKLGVGVVRDQVAEVAVGSTTVTLGAATFRHYHRAEGLN